MRKNFIENQLHALPFANAQNEQSEKGTMRFYFVEELRSLYWTEKYLLKNLSKIQNAATTRELQELLEDHSSITDDHVERIEEIFSLLDEITQVKKCEPADAILKEINHMVYKLDQNIFTKDFCIVSAINKIQCYQVAVYQNLIHIVTILRESMIEGILQRSLAEEKKVLEMFTSFSKLHLNETNLLETESEL